MSKTVDFLRRNGYPLRIKGNDGFNATLVDIQPLVDGDYEGVYRYPRGDCVHHLEEIKKFFEVVEQ